MTTATTNPTAWHDGCEREIFTVKCKAFATQQLRTVNRVIVDADCNVQVWKASDAVDEFEGGYFTPAHSLSHAMVAKIRRMAGVR